MKYSILVFASGKGSLLEHLHFSSKKNQLKAKIIALVSDQKDCLATKKAKNLKIPFFILDPSKDSDLQTQKLIRDLKPDLVVLAGFLKKIGKKTLKSFPFMINTHPSLLPEFKGLYGSHIHEQVIESKKAYTGVSIHQVSEEYDEGRILSQLKIKVPNGINASDLEKIVKTKEKDFLVQSINEIIEGKIKF